MVGKLRFFIRDLFWLALVLGVCLAWWGDHARLKDRERRVQQWLESIIVPGNYPVERIFEQGPSVRAATDDENR